MNDNNTAVRTSTPKQPKQDKKPKHESGVKQSSLSDAWKFGSFCVRATVAAITGKVIGNSSVDDAMGEAFASIYPPEEACDKGKHYSFLVNGMAGAWKAARGDDEWE